jgi:hypothetical protein
MCLPTIEGTLGSSAHGSGGEISAQVGLCPGNPGFCFWDLGAQDCRIWTFMQVSFTLQILFQSTT